MILRSYLEVVGMIREAAWEAWAVLEAAAPLEAERPLVSSSLSTRKGIGGSSTEKIKHQYLAS